MNYTERFKVRPGSSVKLEEIDPGFTNPRESRKLSTEQIKHDTKRLRELQVLLYADGRRSLLLCLQGMDTAGKDGTITHILGAMNPQGCNVVAFKKPSAEELRHNFLWRIRRAVPGPGEVTIFNRSQYEDVLIARVHNLVSPDTWSGRYDQINTFESSLINGNTHILKFFLYISKREQLRRFKDRLDNPSKQWKIREADYEERPFWDEYTAAYEDALSRCSSDHAPWFIIPSNHKWFRNLAVARIVVEHMEALKLKFPLPAVDLENIRKEYHSAKALGQ